MNQLKETKPVIKVEGLVRQFGHFTAVNNISFEVKPGEIFGFLGANGAGKTTAIRILCGLLSPSSGKVDVAGFDVTTQTELVKRNIGYMSQRFSLYSDLTVFENLRFYGGVYGLSKQEINERSDALLQKLGFEDLRNTLISSIPLGWKQKLSFSLALFHRPKIVFLDEPTGGVDPITRRQFWGLIYEAANAGTTVFVTTHYMDEAEYCDRISIMVDGKIVAIGKPEELKNQYNSTSIDEVFVKLARS